MNEHNLLSLLSELLVKSSQMLSLTGAIGRPKEEMKVLEMTLNKSDVMLDKTKLFIIKLSKLYIILPFSITKIEVRMRNVVINSNPKFYYESGHNTFLEIEASSSDDRCRIVHDRRWKVKTSKRNFFD